MKCLNCGTTTDHYLCSCCQNPDILDKIFNEIRFYNQEKCSNPNIMEFANGLTEKYAERNIIPELLEMFDSGITDFYYCLYYKMCRDVQFEEKAIHFIQSHDINDIRTQNILYNLIDSYIPNDFIKPQKWCNIIVENKTLCCELYMIAAKYFSMIGEYDLSDTIADRGLVLCKGDNYKSFMMYEPNELIFKLSKQKSDTNRYRTKKPYWPITEERRRAVAVFYDKKGIKYPRITLKPKKVNENDFSPINECFEDNFDNYCAFWCSESFSISSAKSIYQIAAVKVCNKLIVDEFQQLVRPWDGKATIKNAAKESGIELSAIENAEDVDLVMQKFFEFIGSDILVSTGALGNQAKLISRAARYSGMNEIKNEFYDILDLAAETSEEFDFDNNTREYLLAYFSIREGKTALEKAEVNKQLYDALKEYGE